MQRANRPHDLKEVCSKIGGEFDSSAIQKSLDHLCTLNRVQMKTYSKVNIYCIVQDDEEPDLVSNLI